MLNKIVKREGALPEGPPSPYLKGLANKASKSAHVAIVPMPAALAGARLEAEDL